MKEVVALRTLDGHSPVASPVSALPMLTHPPVGKAAGRSCGATRFTTPENNYIATSKLAITGNVRPRMTCCPWAAQAPHARRRVAGSSRDTW
ncbi:MAG: hypothetical protein U0075_21880 [Thermomicrobiales bacterium]